jgi:hypothetical protein
MILLYFSIPQFRTIPNEKQVKAKGGLKAVVVSIPPTPSPTLLIHPQKISHPHFYTTHLEWATAFSCPIYVSSDDQEWLSRPEPNNQPPLRTFLNTPTTQILPGITAIKAGGHFPGSLVLHSEKDSLLLLADTIMTVPVGMAGANNTWTTFSNSKSNTGQSGIYHVERPPGTTSYSFMWSYPNMIPLAPDAVLGIWNAIKKYRFTRTFGGFMGQDVRGDVDLRGRILESMKIWVKAAGHGDHIVMSEV